MGKGPKRGGFQFRRGERHGQLTSTGKCVRGFRRIVAAPPPWFFVSESGFGVYFAVNDPNGIQFHVPLFFLFFFAPTSFFFFFFGIPLEIIKVERSLSILHLFHANSLVDSGLHLVLNPQTVWIGATPRMSFSGRRVSLLRPSSRRFSVSKGLSENGELSLLWF